MFSPFKGCPFAFMTGGGKRGGGEERRREESRGAIGRYAIQFSMPAAKRSRTPAQHSKAKKAEKLGWRWEDEGVKEGKRTYHYSAVFTDVSSSFTLRIGDLALVPADADDTAARKLGLTYWAGVVEGLWEEGGEKVVWSRWCDLSAQWAQARLDSLTSAGRKKSLKENLILASEMTPGIVDVLPCKGGELIETDECGEVGIDYVKGKASLFGSRREMLEFIRKNEPLSFRRIWEEEGLPASVPPRLPSCEASKEEEEGKKFRSPPVKRAHAMTEGRREERAKKRRGERTVRLEEVEKLRGRGGEPTTCLRRSSRISAVVNGGYHSEGTKTKKEEVGAVKKEKLEVASTPRGGRGRKPPLQKVVKTEEMPKEKVISTPAKAGNKSGIGGVSLPLIPKLCFDSLNPPHDDEAPSRPLHTPLKLQGLHSPLPSARLTPCKKLTPRVGLPTPGRQEFHSEIAAHLSFPAFWKGEGGHLPSAFFSRFLVVRCDEKGAKRGVLNEHLFETGGEGVEGRSRRFGGEERKHSLMAGGKGEEEVGEAEEEVDDMLRRGLEALTLTNGPSKLPCREKERAVVYEFCKAAIEGSSGVMYISGEGRKEEGEEKRRGKEWIEKGEDDLGVGVPGTGKTATVKSVIGELTPLHPTLSFVHVNGLEVGTQGPSEVFRDIWRQLRIDAKASMSVNSAQAAIEAYFKRTVGKKNAGKHSVILLVDEVDFLAEKSQKVLYTLFDWPSIPSSKLSIIAIANTMDLPEKFLPRITSRMGYSRLNFQPYLKPQIVKIIENQLERGGVDKKIFGKGALELVGGKAAAYNGDLRKAFQTMQRALEGGLNRPPPKKSENFISIHDVNLAWKNSFDACGFLPFLTNLPSFSRLILLALLLETQGGKGGKGGDEVSLFRLLKRVRLLLVSYPPEHSFSTPLRPFPCSQGELYESCLHLKEGGILKMERKTIDEEAFFEQQKGEGKDAEGKVKGRGGEMSFPTSGLMKTDRKVKQLAESNEGWWMEEPLSEEVVSLGDQLEAGVIRKAFEDLLGDQVARKVFSLLDSFKKD